MIDIEVKKEGKVFTFLLKGRLNSDVSTSVKTKIAEHEKEADVIVLDFAELKYVSSAGLRVVLELHKEMKAINKSVMLVNVNRDTMEIFESTGLSKFLNIQNG